MGKIIPTCPTAIRELLNVVCFMACLLRLLKPPWALWSILYSTAGHRFLYHINNLLQFPICLRPPRSSEKYRTNQQSVPEIGPKKNRMLGQRRISRKLPELLRCLSIVAVLRMNVGYSKAEIDSRIESTSDRDYNFMEFTWNLPIMISCLGLSFSFRVYQLPTGVRGERNSYRKRD